MAGLGYCHFEIICWSWPALIFLDILKFQYYQPDDKFRIILWNSMLYVHSMYEHITPSLIDLRWLPFESRIIYKILLLVYKAINWLSPTFISNLLSFCSSSYSLRSCLNKLLQVPRSKLKSYGDRRFSIAGSKLWNGITAFLRSADSLNFFKKHLKSYLFHQAFS